MDTTTKISTTPFSINDILTRNNNLDILRRKSMDSSSVDDDFVKTKFIKLPRRSESPVNVNTKIGSEIYKKINFRDNSMYFNNNIPIHTNQTRRGSLDCFLVGTEPTNLNRDQQNSIRYDSEDYDQIKDRKRFYEYSGHAESPLDMRRCPDNDSGKFLNNKIIKTITKTTKLHKHVPIYH